MALKPNIGPTWRVLYAVFGVAIIIVPFAAAMDVAYRVALPVAGGILLATGLSGW